MPVFISYHRPDETQAKSIAQQLEEYFVECYVDVLDNNLIEASNVTATIINALHKSSHLMALVTEQTRNSWWVPFEIGVATETDRRITSYVPASVQLPDFLLEWPVLRSPQDIGKFVNLYNADIYRFYFDKGGSPEIPEKPTMSATQVMDAATFHSQLKRDLNQE